MKSTREYRITSSTWLAGPLVLLALVSGACQSSNPVATPLPTATAVPIEAATTAPIEAGTTVPTVAPIATPTEVAAEPTATAVPEATVFPSATPVAAVEGAYSHDGLIWPAYVFGGRYGVVRIPPNDPDGGLVMHEDPAVDSPVVTVLPRSTSNAFAEETDGNWWFVSVGNFGGWVDSYYLVPLAADLPCESDGNRYSADLTSVSNVPADQNNSGSLAEYLVGIHRYRIGECERVVLTFGANHFEFPEGAFSESAPRATGSGMSVHDIVFAEPLPAKQTEADDGTFPYAFYFNDYDATTGVAIHNNQNRTGRMTWRRFPGQIIVDSVSAPTGTGLHIGPVFNDDFLAADGHGIVFRNAFNYDQNGVAPYRFEMQGYGRPFEAQFGVSIERDGVPVEVTFAVTNMRSGEVSTFTGSDPVPVGTSNWTTGWGRFAFTVTIPDSEPAGLYVMQISDGSVGEQQEFTFCVGAVIGTGCS